MLNDGAVAQREGPRADGKDGRVLAVVGYGPLRTLLMEAKSADVLSAEGGSSQV